jgi:hypothetical protein
MLSMASIALLCAPTLSANAALVISSSSTSHVKCVSGVCTASAADAVLNVSTLQQMLGASSVKIVSGPAAQDIVFQAPLTWSGAQSLTVDAYRSVSVDQTVSVTGAGGVSVVTNDGGSGGSFSCGPVGQIVFASRTNQLNINGTCYTLINTIAGLAQEVAANLSGNFALSQPVDALSVTSWAPIGTDSSGNILNGGAGFSGAFEGLGNTISNLTINLPKVSRVGLFGYSSGTINDVRLANLSVVGKNRVGGLAGVNAGIIGYARITGDDFDLGQGVSGLNYVGGLAGENDNAIAYSFAGISVLDIATGTDVGGLVGINKGEVAKSYATGYVADFLAPNYGSNVGGLIGGNSGSVHDAYATGTVDAIAGTNVGGPARSGTSMRLAGSAMGWAPAPAGLSAITAARLSAAILISTGQGSRRALARVQLPTEPWV